MPETPDFWKVWHTVAPMTFEEFLARRDKQSMVPFTYDDRDDALARAKVLHTQGAIVHLIEGTDGTYLKRPEILHLIQMRRRFLDGRPRKH